MPLALMEEKEYEAIVGLIKLNCMSKCRNNQLKKKKSQRQKNILERVFKITSYPSAITQQDLSILLYIPPRSIQIWFQNARHKIKCNFEDELKDDNNEVPASVLCTIVEEFRYYKQ